jgi:hypothetical protein
MKVIQDKTIKQISVALGTAGQFALMAGYYGKITEPALVLSRFFCVPSRRDQGKDKDEDKDKGLGLGYG